MSIDNTDRFMDLYLVQLVRCVDSKTYIWRYVRSYAEGWVYAGVHPYQQTTPTTEVEAAIVRLLNIALTTEELEAYFSHIDF